MHSGNTGLIYRRWSATDDTCHRIHRIPLQLVLIVLECELPFHRYVDEERHVSDKVVTQCIFSTTDRQYLSIGISHDDVHTPSFGDAIWKDEGATGDQNRVRLITHSGTEGDPHLASGCIQPD